MDVTQLKRCSFCVESDAVKDMREPGIINVNFVGMVSANTSQLFILSPFSRATDVLSSFCDRWPHDGMVCVPKIQALVAKRPLSSEVRKGVAHDRYPQACGDVLARIVAKSNKGIPPRAILEDVGNKREVDL